LPARAPLTAAERDKLVNFAANVLGFSFMEDQNDGPGDWDARVGRMRKQAGEAMAILGSSPEDIKACEPDPDDGYPGTRP